jgi:hypothetical protein
MTKVTNFQMRSWKRKYVVSNEQIGKEYRKTIPFTIASKKLNT